MYINLLNRVMFITFATVTVTLLLYDCKDYNSDYYPSSVSLVELSSLNPSYNETGIVGVEGITRGFVVAILSDRLAPNTNAFDPPQEWDIVAPVDIDHHRLVWFPDSNLQ